MRGFFPFGFAQGQNDKQEKTAQNDNLGEVMTILGGAWALGDIWADIS
jgi:hypothetical protein